MSTDLREKEDYNNQLHVVTFFQFFKKKKTIQKPFTMLCKYSNYFLFNTKDTKEFKTCKNINTRTLDESIQNNSEISRWKRGWNTVNALAGYSGEMM